MNLQVVSNQIAIKINLQYYKKRNLLLYNVYQIYAELIQQSFFSKVDIVKALLDGGADVNAKNKKGTTALTHAMKNGNTGLVKLLKEAGGIRNT